MPTPRPTAVEKVKVVLGRSESAGDACAWMGGFIHTSVGFFLPLLYQVRYVKPALNNPEVLLNSTYRGAGYANLIPDTYARALQS